MKNLTKIAVFVFISAFLFSACEKEGQYLPKKKITRIEYSTTTSSKDGKDISTLSEVQDWVWNGKLLQNITYKDGSGNALTFETKGSQNNGATYGRRNDWKNLYSTAKEYFQKAIDHKGTAKLSSNY